MLRLYTNPQSRGRIARWMLEETGAPYAETVLPLGPALKTREFLALNPMGKVPVLVHEGHVVTEVAAICAYLADAFPEAHLAPPPGLARAAYYRWLFFAAGPLEAAVTNKALGLAPSDEQSGFVGYGSFETMLATLEKAVVSAPFIAGDRFTAADVYVGSQVGWGLMFGTLPRSEPLADYWNRLKDRPARLRADEKDAALAAAGKKDG